MNPEIQNLLQRCTTDAMRTAAIECLASGMTVRNILDLIDTVEGQR